MNRKLDEFLTFIIIGGLYCYTTAVIFLSSTFIDFNNGQLFALSLAAVLGFGIIFYNKYIASVFGVIALLYFIYLSIKLYKNDDYYFNFIKNAFRQITGKYQYDSSYATFFILLAVISISLISSFCIYKKKRVLPLIITSITGYIVLVISDGNPEVTTILLSFLSIIIIYILKRNQGVLRLKAVSLQKVAVYALAIGLISMLLGAIIPKPAQSSTGMYWNIQKSFDGIDGFLNSLINSPSGTSFPKGEVPLGGDYVFDDTKVLEVRSDEPLYLVGSIYNVYTVGGWKKDFAESKPTDKANISSIISEKIETFNKTVEIKTFYSDEMIFYPQYLKNFSFSNDSVLLSDANGNYELLPEISNGETYYAGYETIANLEDSIKILGSSDKSYNIPRNIYSNYLNLPGALPQRVKDLAFDITREYSSKYDKIKALRNYLVENYIYTLTPGDTPGNREFTDYFLFDQNEGYCTYFATAMAILSRSIGVPSRYITGYVTPISKNNNGAYEVTNETAHAWTEVYLSGLGWIKIEATPSYSSPGDEYYYLGDDNTESNTETSDVSSSISSSEIYSSDVISEQSPSSILSDPTQSKVNNSSDESETNLSQYNNNLSEFTAVIIWIIILSIIVLAYLIRVLWVLIRIKKIKKAIGNKKIILIFNEIMRIGETNYSEKKLYESAIMYFVRLSEYPIFRNFDLQFIARIYSAVEFGRYTCSPNEVNKTFDIYNSIVKKQKAKLKSFKFIISRYFLNKI